MLRWCKSLISKTLIAAALLAAALPASAQDGTLPPGTRFSGIQVDVRPLLATGLNVYAERVRAELQAALTRTFADRVGGPGPVLVVRVTGLSLNPYAGSETRDGRGGGNATNTDYLEGEALVVDRRGTVLLRHPQLSATNASSGGAWYDPASERRRVTYIAGHYAQWLRRGLGLD
ncbi:hypothetical protein VQ03_15130 [Methylobacterium tarhaniae]|uniref:DUF3016 domain-containing protein n=1 Tax=Methylobacterium tarhaniae TaxID=1187852 RepID=A0A0J6VL20_9HYPH|nr:hypothetical protein [Methylobacterium tarhaniae]KMO39846.1 hypothetical protein VQ03_15130 [Methylobacterium tarhaniae]